MRELEQPHEFESRSGRLARRIARFDRREQTPCEPLRVDAELLNGGRFPMIGPQQGSDVVEIGRCAAARIDHGSARTCAQSKAVRVGDQCSVEEERTDERIA
jgi:hypothetical protein